MQTGLLMLTINVAHGANGLFLHNKITSPAIMLLSISAYTTYSLLLMKFMNPSFMNGVLASTIGLGGVYMAEMWEQKTDEPMDLQYVMFTLVCGFTYKRFLMLAMVDIWEERQRERRREEEEAAREAAEEAERDFNRSPSFSYIGGPNPDLEWLFAYGGSYWANRLTNTFNLDEQSESETEESRSSQYGSVLLVI